MYQNIIIQRRKSLQPDVVTQHDRFIATGTLCIQPLSTLVQEPCIPFYT